MLLPSFRAGKSGCQNATVGHHGLCLLVSEDMNRVPTVDTPIRKMIAGSGCGSTTTATTTTAAAAATTTTTTTAAAAAAAAALCCSVIESLNLPSFVLF